MKRLARTTWSNHQRLIIRAFLDAPGHALDSISLRQVAERLKVGNPTMRLSELSETWLFQREWIGLARMRYTLVRRLTTVERRQAREKKEAKRLKVNDEPRRVQHLSELNGKTCKISVNGGRIVFAALDGAWWAPVFEGKGSVQLPLGV